ncbi:Flp family type IVb pilin [Shimia ponticola]|uniref:Flp family type IVb pilin n=1 Tax=Shimia ponticola TaxID=2582893 RepID=UPI0011BE412D|nr:Flp family type IVb pilin [Shimia ponticola]
MKPTFIRKMIASFAKDEEGATAIEYGLFAALVGAGIVAIVATLGDQTEVGFTTISTELETAGIEAPPST